MRVPQSERRRRVRPAWVVLGVLVVVAVVVLGIVHARSRRDPQAAPSDSGSSSVVRSSAAPSTSTSTSSSSSSAPAAPAALPVGITFGGALFGLSRSHIDDALDDVVALHMTWIRIDVSWASLQPTSSRSFNWSPMDPIIDSARAHHLHVLGLLTYTPSWARQSGCTSFVCPPRSTGQFADFAAAVVSRYHAQGLTTYQIWNEPNISLFWSNPDPAAYGRLLVSAVAAMRAVDRSVHVLFGGLAFTTDVGEDIAPARFLVDACSGRTCPVEAVGYDPFTYPSLPSKKSHPLNAWQLMADSSAGRIGLRSALDRAGLGKVKIWVTEFGAPTTFPGSDDRTVTEAQQADIVVDGLRLARSATYVGGYFVDTWKDTGSAGPMRNHFGLIRHDGTHKPAFAALARALAK